MPSSDSPAKEPLKPNRPTRQRSRLRKLFLVLSSTFLGLTLAVFLAELGVRLFVQVTDVPYQFGDPLIGPRRLPSQTGINRMSKHSNARYRFNAQGWNHPRDYIIPKPKSTRRICLVGDSFVESLQVDVDKTMFCEAERLMSRPGAPVEWLAFGCSGFGTTQEHELIRHYVLDYRPDIVVLFFVQNDPWDSSPYLMPIEECVTTYRLDDMGDLELMPPTIYTPDPFRRASSHLALVRYLVLQRRLLERIAGVGPTAPAVQLREGALIQKGFREPSAEKMTLEERRTKTWELTEKTLAAMRDECKHRGAELMIVFRGNEPVIEAARTGKPANRPPKSEDPYCLGSRVQDMGPEWVEPIAARLGIPYLDMTAPLSEAVAKSGQSHVFPDDSHYNEMAHGVAARAMAEWIETHWKARSRQPG